MVIEKELPIYVNGEHLVTASIAPGMEKEFVAGYLFGQGFINSIDEIISLEIENNTAKVTLKDNRKTSSGTDRPTTASFPAAAGPPTSGSPAFRKIKSDIKIPKANIFGHEYPF